MPAIRRHSLLPLYDEAVVDNQLANFLPDDDDDSYDVYLFYPSIDPYVLMPEDFLQDGVVRDIGWFAHPPH